jgi:hypothetical protein
MIGGGFQQHEFAPGVELGPWGELCILGGMFTPSFTPRSEDSLLFRKMEGQTEGLDPLGDKFTPRGKSLTFIPWCLKHSDKIEFRK